MLSHIKYLIFFLVLISANLFSAEVEFINPLHTPPGTTPPNLSITNNVTQQTVKVATDSTGQYVYAVWDRTENFKGRIQIAISHDYGITFSNPTITPADDGSPNLSKSNLFANDPHVATNSTGQYVYVIWQANDNVQIAISSNHGRTFSDPTTTPAGTPYLANLAPTEVAAYPQIATDSTGQYVYIVWSQAGIVRIIISQNYGVDFPNPATSISVSLSNSTNPQIATDSTGQYVYVVWERDYGGNDWRIQIARSQNNGAAFSSPTTTPGVPPALSITGGVAINSQVATDSTGQHVYVVWRRNDGSNERIQIAISGDFGDTFSDPTTTPGGKPNLSIAGEDAFDSQVATDSTGQHVYVTWRRNDGLNFRIQIAISGDLGVTFSDPTTTPASDGTPNLSQPGEIAQSIGNALRGRVATDSTGQYVYVVWRQQITTNPINTKVQIAISQDYGNTFSDPTTTEFSPPNLSAFNSDFPQVTTNSTGDYIYVIWTNTLTKTAQIGLGDIIKRSHSHRRFFITPKNL